MIKDIEATAKEIIEKNLPYPPIDRDGDEVMPNWATCIDQLWEKLNDSVGTVYDLTDTLNGTVAEGQIEILQNSSWFETLWEDYVSDYCTDKQYEQEMFNEAKRLP